MFLSFPELLMSLEELLMSSVTSFGELLMSSVMSTEELAMPFLMWFEKFLMSSEEFFLPLPLTSLMDSAAMLSDLLSIGLAVVLLESGNLSRPVCRPKTNCSADAHLSTPVIEGVCISKS